MTRFQRFFSLGLCALVVTVVATVSHSRAAWTTLGGNPADFGDSVTVTKLDRHTTASYLDGNWTDDDEVKNIVSGDLDYRWKYRCHEGEYCNHGPDWGVADYLDVDNGLDESYNGSSPAQRRWGACRIEDQGSVSFDGVLNGNHKVVVSSSGSAGGYSVFTVVVRTEGDFFAEFQGGLGVSTTAANLYKCVDYTGTTHLYRINAQSGPSGISESTTTWTAGVAAGTSGSRSVSGSGTVSGIDLGASVSQEANWSGNISTTVSVTTQDTNPTMWNRSYDARTMAEFKLMNTTTHEISESIEYRPSITYRLPTEESDWYYGWFGRPEENWMTWIEALYMVPYIDADLDGDETAEWYSDSTHAPQDLEYIVVVEKTISPDE
ncbi:MAG: hypothetical protein KDB07_02365 [Planctomycetes bacterium]|nr:hypothetical protein [Planctomycetota bacterium]